MNEIYRSLKNQFQEMLEVPFDYDALRLYERC